MAISSIQPITNFSMILPATLVSPREMLSVASDLVKTPGASAIVTLGTAQPLSQPLFNSAGLIDFAHGGGLLGFPTNGVSLGALGSVGQTPQSQALASELFSALNDSSSTGFGGALAAATQNLVTNTTGATSGTASGTTNNSISTLNNLINANLDLAITGLNSTDTTTSALNGTLAANVQLALVGIGGGAGTTAVVGTPSATTTPAANGLVAAPTVTATPATTPAATTTPTPLSAATVTPANATTTAGAATPIATPATTLTTTAGAAATPTAGTLGTALVGISPTALLQSLVADVNARAAANLIDPGFAATSAGLFISAAVFRASGTGAVTTGMGIADTAGAPPPEVTAVRPAQVV